MDFSNLGQNSPFYILRKQEKPTLLVGTVKEKQVKPQYGTQAPNVFNGMQVQQVADITVTVGGNDMVFQNVPVNVEIASRSNGDEVFTGSREAMLQAVSGMIDASKKALQQVDYHKLVLSEGETILETLNPRYAEEKQRDRTIKELLEHRRETDSKLDQILAFMRDLTSPSKK